MHRATTTMRWLAVFGIAAAFACVIEDEQPREVEENDPYRDGGCGAGRKPGTGSEACTYTAKARYQNDWWHAAGKCIDGNTDQITCTYDGDKYVTPSWCYWETTAKVDGCAAPSPGNNDYPACSDYPAVTDATTDANGGIVFKTKIEAVVPLPEGSTLCDPKKKDSELADFCMKNIPPDTLKKLLALCTDVKAETKKKDIDCCVKKDGMCAVIDDTSGGETTECAFDTSSGDALSTTGVDTSTDPTTGGEPIPLPSPG